MMPLISWLAIILIRVITSPTVLTILGKETPEFMRAIGYAIVGALCTQIITSFEISGQNAYNMD
jgi:hypothetical protein